MKFLKIITLILIVCFTFMFASPSWADRPNFKKNADYLEITQKLTQLSATPEPTPEVAQQIADLQFIKYTIETGAIGGQCTNNTGKTLAVYGSDPDNEEDEAPTSYSSDLYFLADKQSTDAEWDCDGFYIPNDVSISVVGQTTQGPNAVIQGPAAVKIIDGSQLVVTTNPETTGLEFDAPFSKVVKTKEVNWFIPNISQSIVDKRVANAPVNE